MLGARPKHGKQTKQTKQSRNQIMSETKAVKTLQELQASLPPGIKVSIGRNEIHYIVRSSRKGKKVSLGTFTCPILAMKALAAFKANLPFELTQEDMKRIIATEQEKEIEIERRKLESVKLVMSKHDMFKILYDNVPAHEIDASKPYNYVTPEGNTIIIPKIILSEYLDKLVSGEFEEEDI
jgi:hypothetical protein